ncbi:hypothetical protein MXMO3_02470 [Maritalea myrionectae]|uniref:SH3b domain-containing protein n=1 Tax=Maritalea myrionectae TaxID=454601 RepID=A0A2R4MG41_9HYPH|nr:hypothetical protein [Maritalea myrionectae]AVX04982.1 hypothetical protein MXMO3_02470 [Maritalea myrionectae]
MRSLYSALFLVCLFLAMPSAAHATEACAITSNIEGATGVTLYAAPDDTSQVIREIPLDDLVLYPNEELAPAQHEGWVWVRHDTTQEDIWQCGEYGWVRIENLTDCG